MIESEIRNRLQRSFTTTLPRFDLMAQLDREPDGLSMSDLSARLMVSNGNTTGVVSRLVEDGLVSRVPSATDRRTFYVKLTARGRTLFRAMAAEHETWVREMFAQLHARDVAALMQLLATTKNSVRAKTSPYRGDVATRSGRGQIRSKNG